MNKIIHNSGSVSSKTHCWYHVSLKALLSGGDNDHVSEPAGSEAAKFRLWVKSKGLSLTRPETKHKDEDVQDGAPTLFVPTGTDKVGCSRVINISCKINCQKLFVSECQWSHLTISWAIWRWERMVDWSGGANHICRLVQAVMLQWMMRYEVRYCAAVRERTMWVKCSQ